jgi:hypothetical protein
MSNVQVHRRLHRVQAIEAREVIVVVVVTAPMAEIEQCVVAVVEATLVVVGAESGCWCEEMQLSLLVLVRVVRAVAVAVAVAVADAFIQVALVDSVNLASHLCLSHL